MVVVVVDTYGFLVAVFFPYFTDCIFRFPYREGGETVSGGSNSIHFFMEKKKRKIYFVINSFIDLVYSVSIMVRTVIIVVIISFIEK